MIAIEGHKDFVTPYLVAQHFMVLHNLATLNDPPKSNPKLFRDPILANVIEKHFPWYGKFGQIWRYFV